MRIWQIKVLLLARHNMSKLAAFFQSGKSIIKDFNFLWLHFMIEVCDKRLSLT